MNIQWYPGHMTKAKRMMQENLKLIDVVVELVDARVPLSSKNPDIDELAKNKRRIIVLNKIDLADNIKTEQWVNWYQEQGFHVDKVNSKTGAGLSSLMNNIKEVCKDKIERDLKRGIKNRPVRAMIVGIPNVGKSTFINKLVGKASARTGNKPGVTKGKQWIKLKKDIELLDTPGILWPKFEDQQVGLKLAMIGTIKDELLDVKDVACQLINILKNNYTGLLNSRYNIDENKDDYSILISIAESRNIKKSGNEYDLERTANILIDEYRSGKIGHITLE